LHPKHAPKSAVPSGLASEFPVKHFEEAH
jgi:hypothetical protein